LVFWYVTLKAEALEILVYQTIFVLVSSGLSQIENNLLPFSGIDKIQQQERQDFNETLTNGVLSMDNEVCFNFYEYL